MFAWAVDAIVDTPRPTAVCVIAEALKLSQWKEVILDALKKAIDGRGTALTENILQCVHHGFWNDVASVICSILHLQQVKATRVLNPLIKSMPPRAQLECDSAFLEIASVLRERAALMRCTIFLEVVKRTLMTKHLAMRQLVTKVVCAFCSVEGFAEWFCEGEVFDYVVESMREVGEGRNETLLMRLAVGCLEAIVSAQPKGLQFRWCYCLESVFIVCGRMSGAEGIQKAMKVFCEGLEGAPVASVSEVALQALLAFIMSLLPKVCPSDSITDAKVEEKEMFTTSFNKGIEGLITFLGKYRPSVQVVHSVLAICEASVTPKNLRPRVFALLTQVVQNLKNLANEALQEKGDHEKNVVQGLAQRLLFVIFGCWGEALENTLDSMDTVSSEDETVEGLLHLLNMFSNGLDPVFVALGSCDKNDRDAICAWCWRYFPPRTAFAIPAVTNPTIFHGSARSLTDTREEVIRQYLWCITMDRPVDRTTAFEEIPTTEAEFLEDIVKMASCPTSFTMKILEKGITFDCLSLLGGPGLIVKALSAGLCELQSNWSKEACSQSLRYLQSISRMCIQCTAAFQELDVPQNVWERVIAGEDLFASGCWDVLVFCLFLRRGVRDNTDTLAWEKLTENLSVIDSRFLENSRPLAMTCIENADASTSILYAIANSSHPRRISNFMLDISDANNIGSDLVISLQNAGVMDILRDLLEEILRMLSDASSTEHFGSVQQNQNNAYTTILLRIRSLISIISPTSFGYDFQTKWSILRLVTQTFMSLSTSTCYSTFAIQLQSALLKWLIIILKSSKGKEYCSYACQSGIASHIIQRLQRVLEECWDFFRDEFISIAASFLVLLLQDDNHCSKILNPLVIKLLRDATAWDQLLCYSSYLHTDSSFKITNSCHLLNCILLRNSLRKTDRIAWCPRVHISLSAAAFSANTLVREAALATLGTVMELQPEKCSATDAFTMHLMLSRHLVTKFCLFRTEPMSAVELRYLISAVNCGHADDYILEIEKEVVCRSELIEKSKERSSLFNKSSHCHLIALRAQIMHRSKGAASTEPSREYMPSKLIRKAEVLLSRNAVVLRSVC